MSSEQIRDTTHGGGEYMRSKQQQEMQELINIARKHQIAYLAVFGSYARGNIRPDSDIDLYARFGRPVGLFEMLGIKHEMEDAVGRSVDLVAEEVVEPHPFMRDGLSRDLIVLHDMRETHAPTQ
jgi:predicted nucleotidyltransferase